MEQRVIIRGHIPQVVLDTDARAHGKWTGPRLGRVHDCQAMLR
jgi:hypothetical protein